LERKRTYECMCLLDNREVKAGWQPLKESVVGIFSKHGAEVVSARRWDERRLAFPIKGQQRATYLLAYIKAGTQQVAGIRRDLQFKEAVLRSMMFGCEEVPAMAFEPEAAFDVNAIPTEDRPRTRTAAAEEPAAAGPADAGEAVPATDAEPGDDAEPAEATKEEGS
jgi:small subunit ribosomal protein S6